jgi:hypothetical protein
MAARLHTNILADIAPALLLPKFVWGSNYPTKGGEWSEGHFHEDGRHLKAHEFSKEWYTPYYKRELKRVRRKLLLLL